MKRTFYSLCALALTCCAAVPAAYGQFTLSAEVRPRAELRDGFKTPSSDDFDPAFFIEQRTRLYADYQAPRYKLRFALQDIRLWGQTPQVFKEEIGVSFLSEGWGEFSMGKGGASLRVGRQILSYDNQRFLGGLEWAQQGRRHDAALFKFQPADKGLKLHVGVAFNTDDDVPEYALLQREGANFYTTGGNYKAMQFAWANKTFGSGDGNVSFLALNAVNQNPDTTVSNKQTFGLIPSYKLGGVKLAADLYYQTGELGGNSVGAYLLGARATFPTSVTPITVGFEAISGKDDDDASADITNFSPDYGTNHAFNGLMDYFFVGPANGNVGVNDFFVKTKFGLGEKGGAPLAHAHHFLTGSTQLDAEGGELDRSMGTELDLVYTRVIAGGVRIHLGYSHLRATETMLALRPGNREGNNWAWAMVTFKPTLFKQEPDVQEDELSEAEAVQPLQPVLAAPAKTVAMPATPAPAEATTLPKG